jgi:GntR family transcriptional regulator
MPVPMSYREIAEDLAARIKAGEYKPGEMLPSYAGLADLYSVSRSTASRVYSITNDRGITVGSPGRGVFVAGESQA